MFITLKDTRERKDQRRPGDRATAAAPGSRCRAPACSCNPSRTCASEDAHRRRAISIHAAKRQRERSEPVGAPGASKLRTLPQLADVNIDQQNKGLESNLVIDRNTAARFGISPQTDRRHALRRVRAAPGLHAVYAADPVSRGHGSRSRVLAESGRRCNYIYVKASNGSQVPLSAFTHYVADTTRRWR